MKKSQGLMLFSLLGLLLICGFAAFAFTVGNTDEGYIPVVTNETAPNKTNVERIQQCVQTTYTTYDSTKVECPLVTHVCYDEPTNLSCEDITSVTFCEGPAVYVDHVRTDCTEAGLVLFGTYKIDESTFKCSVIESDASATVICDSIYDGNGDGICHSGETCMKYEVTPKSISRSEKNSEEEFKQTSDSVRIVAPSVALVAEVSQ